MERGRRRLFKGLVACLLVCSFIVGVGENALCAQTGGAKTTIERQALQGSPMPTRKAVRSLGECEETKSLENRMRPCADNRAMIYRIYQGRRQKRGWNYTQNRWEDPHWIDIGLAGNPRNRPPLPPAEFPAPPYMPHQIILDVGELI